MAMYREIPKADGSGSTNFYRMMSTNDDVVDTGEENTTSTMYDYNSALNKPAINGVPLVGDKSLEDLGLQAAGNYIEEIPEYYITEEELNNKNYATQQYVIEQINGIEHFHREKVDALPLKGKENIIYLVPKTGKNGDVYEEYIWVDGDYEFIGTTSPDLSIFYTKEEADALLSGKVSVVAGKQLSTNDYTTSEKDKLAQLNNYDDSALWSKVNALENYNDTEVRGLIEDNSTNIATNTQDIQALEDEMGYKTKIVRLIKSGDAWSWLDGKGNVLNYEQAQSILGQSNGILALEDLENDGKFSPLIYVSNDSEIAAFFMGDDKKIHVLSGSENPEDVPMGYFINYADAVDTVEDLRSYGDMDGEVRRVKATNDLYLYDSVLGDWVPFDKGAAIDLSNYLSKTNTTPYNPTSAYNPATKRYVDSELDDKIPTKVSELQNDAAYVGKATKDLTYYYTSDNLYTKKEVDALIKNSGGGGSSNINISVSGDTLFIDTI